MANENYTLTELCICAASEAFRSDGEVLATGIGTIPRLAAGLAWRTHSPDLMMTDAECSLVSEPVPVGPRGDYVPKFEGQMPFRRIFELLWSGRRHAMTPPTQIDRFGITNISAIGDYEKPKVMLLGVRGIPGNTISHPCSFFIGNHSPRSFVADVDMASGVGHDPSRWDEGVGRGSMDLRLVVSNLGVLDFGGPDHQMRITKTHPGVSIDDIQAQTGFELAVADDVSETPAPSDEQLRIIREDLDPHSIRVGQVKEP